MFIILAYTPILLCLPVLLLTGVVFVVVTGGFIIVLGGLYFAAMGLVGLFGLAADMRWRARASRVRRANTTLEYPSASGRASFGTRGPTPPNPVAVPLAPARVVGPAPSLVRRRRGSDEVDRVGPLDRGRVATREAGARHV